MPTFTKLPKSKQRRRCVLLPTSTLLAIIVMMMAVIMTPKAAMGFSPMSLNSPKIMGQQQQQIRSISSFSSQQIVPSLLRLSSSPSEDIAVEEESAEEREKRLKKEAQDQIFWAKQKALAASMTADTDAAVKKEQLTKFAERRLALVSDTLFFSILLFSFLWFLFPSPQIALSYEFGAILGTAYSYGLGKYVETLGGSTEDEGAVEGAGVGQARFAFLILLFVVLGKFRGQMGLQELPAIGGFFTYQLASLNQGLKEYYD